MAHDEEHVTPKQYLLVGLWLGIFTIVTVGASYLHLSAGPAIALALVIASIKVTLVGMYFMHLKYEGALIRSLLLLTAVFFAVLVTIPLVEFSHHPWAEEGAIPAVTAEHHAPAAAPADAHAGHGHAAGDHSGHGH